MSPNGTVSNSVTSSGNTANTNGNPPAKPEDIDLEPRLPDNDIVITNDDLLTNPNE